MRIDDGFLLIVKASGIGEGEIDLGEKLAASFFNALSNSDAFPARIVFIGTGIFLTTDGSPVLDAVRELEKRGTEILSCTTCLDYYGRADKLLVGRPTNMNESVGAMLGFDKVVTL